MKNAIIPVLLAVCCVTAGCDRVADLSGVGGGVDPTDPCGAQNYTSLLGAPLAAVTLPADLNDRVLRPGDAATTDYIPSRLNIELDDAGTVIGLSCG